jgi:hypothetical protein
MLVWFSNLGSCSLHLFSENFRDILIRSTKLRLAVTADAASQPPSCSLHWQALRPLFVPISRL